MVSVAVSSSASALICANPEIKINGITNSLNSSQIFAPSKQVLQVETEYRNNAAGTWVPLINSQNVHKNLTRK